MQRQNSSCPGMQSPISNFTLSSLYPPFISEATDWKTCSVNTAAAEQSSDKAGTQGEAIAPSPSPAERESPIQPTASTANSNAICTANHRDFTRALSRSQRLGAHLHPQCSTFSPQENFKAHAVFIPDGKSLLFVTSVLPHRMHLNNCGLKIRIRRRSKVP